MIDSEVTLIDGGLVMACVFLGKFSNKNPEQVQKKFYSAGAEGGI